MPADRKQNDLSDGEVAERLERTVRRMMATPPQPRPQKRMKTPVQVSDKTQDRPKLKSSDK